ncbi:conserved hypothetical protein [Parafrankia sp. Ea1.12]|uniref:phosphotransferase enzyme family protein n=1 Tax=Parafrankia sp. Ea1.12 TaxID=573499 RepID=UPI000DA57B01|nr:phosphotransferase [Parafrankia sp. Ea1.12]SQD98566.1 conserved hypothetical protein [Parafrankia sp. Ea1.12]
MASYTTADQIDLATVADRYALEGTRLTPLPGGAANSSFHLWSAGGEYVLTILDNHDLSSARRLAVHTQAVFGLGIRTTEILPSVDGDLVTKLGDRPVILKRWIAGEVLDPLPVSLLPVAGRTLAHIHQLEPHTPGLNDVPRGTRRLSDEQEAVISQFVDEEFGSWLAEQLKRVHVAEANREHAKSIVHGDLFADNIIVTGDGEIAVLDWETVSLDDPLLDLGMAIVGLGQESGLLAPERMDALVAGYREVAILDETELGALPVQIISAAVIIAYHRYLRHNIRFPNPDKNKIHLEMVEFVNSVEENFPLPA